MLDILHRTVVDIPIVGVYIIYPLKGFPIKGGMPMAHM